MVFAREVSGPLTSLVKKLDAATAQNKSCSMGSFVVFLTDDEGLEEKLKNVADKQDLKNTVLTIDNPAGPKGYNVAKDADITVILYQKKTVKSNFAYKKGEFSEKEIDKILADLPKILPETK